MSRRLSDVFLEERTMCESIFKLISENVSHIICFHLILFKVADLLQKGARFPQPRSEQSGWPVPLAERGDIIHLTQSTISRLLDIVAQQEAETQRFLRVELEIDGNSGDPWRIRAPWFRGMDFDSNRWCTAMSKNLAELAILRHRLEALLRDCDYLRQEVNSMHPFPITQQRV